MVSEAVLGAQKLGGAVVGREPESDEVEVELLEALDAVADL
jgi:hypothetical protein